MLGVTGALTGRDYRLSTLGLDRIGQVTVSHLQKHQSQQEKTRQQIERLVEIRLLKLDRQWPQLGFQEEIAEWNNVMGVSNATLILLPSLDSHSKSLANISRQKICGKPCVY
jgi:hypothetical protein